MKRPDMAPLEKRILSMRIKVCLSIDISRADHRRDATIAINSNDAASHDQSNGVRFNIGILGHHAALSAFAQ